MKKNVLFLFLVSSLFFPIISMAQHFQSNSYIIDWGNFNMTSGTKNSPNYNLTDTVGQNSPGQFNSTGYIVKSGFQYIYDQFFPFSFSISNLNINLGTLVAGVASTGTNIITVSSPAGHGYDIYAIENHPFAQSTGYTIPDTTCDAGNCNQSVSGIWTSATTYGFGFNSIGINSSGVATGVGTSSIFPDDTYFRHFANQKANETPQVIMSYPVAAKNHRSRISYKVNVSGVQAAGNYENAITFIAVPKY